MTRDVTAGRESRTWIAVEPAPAAGPHDESIPSVRVVVGQLTAIGYCVPAAISHLTRHERLWRIEPDTIGARSPRPDPTSGATPIPIVPLDPLTQRTAGVADLFGPPAGDQRWTAGTYVFALTLGRSSDPLWFSLEVVDSPPVPDPPTEGPAPSRPPSPP